MLKPQFILPLEEEMLIDLFAGGGGASTGIEWATGRHVDVAVNHSREAVAVHQANHPQTRHFVEDVFAVDPVEVVQGRPVGLLWASPDCKHFSKAKGGKPVSKKIRGLAWIVIKWAKLVRPRIIFVENVEEFQTWGPLGPDNKPCKIRKGRTFERWKRSLEALGYEVGYKEDRACDFGTPTIRKRLFLVARCDGEPIVFPEVSYAAPDALQVIQKKLKPYKTAAGCIQWEMPAPSIFERSRELADATKRRIAKGIMRYVVDAKQPFIVPLTHQGGDRTEDINKPFMTITGANRGEKALIVPTLVQTGYGEREGQAPRALDLHKPLGTTVDGQKHALVTAFLTEHANSSTQRVFPAAEPMRTQTGEVKGGHFSMVTAALVAQQNNHRGSEPSAGRAADEPMSTVTTSPQQSLVTASLVGVGARAGQSRPRGMEEPTATTTAKYDTALLTAHLTKFRSGSVGSGMDEPVDTITAGGEPARPSTGNVMGLVTAHIMTMRNAQKPHTAADEPTHTITAGGAHQTLVTSNLIKLRGTSKEGQAIDEPLHTVSAGGTHHAEVRAFLIKYYGTDQNPKLDEPMHTIPTKDRFGLVMVKGEPYAIVDIGLRMLNRRELFRANGFPDSYIIEWGIDPVSGQKITINNTISIRLCGNCVCPQMAEAYVRANYKPRRAVQPPIARPPRRRMPMATVVS